MKMITFFITLLLSVAMLCSSCSVTGNREKTLLGNPVVKVPTLLDKTNWTTDTIANGIIYYNFAAKDEVSDASQIVNVLELDLTNPVCSGVFYVVRTCQVHRSYSRNECRV